jgi:hypothetical protein
VEQVAQVMVDPQPSGWVPQREPQVAGVQPQVRARVPPPQLWGAVQSPQKSTPEQPSETTPQVALEGQAVWGLQLLLPHWLGPAPPQIAPPEQAEQLSTPPQPSGIWPQLLAPQLAGVHPHTLG